MYSVISSFLLVGADTLLGNGSLSFGIPIAFAKPLVINNCSVWQVPIVFISKTCDALLVVERCHANMTDSTMKRGLSRKILYSNSVLLVAYRLLI